MTEPLPKIEQLQKDLEQAQQEFDQAMLSALDWDEEMSSEAVAGLASTYEIISNLADVVSEKAARLSDHMDDLALDEEIDE